VLSYAPPALSSFLGPGSDDADTDGGESVVIFGHNFGFQNTSALGDIYYRSASTGNMTFRPSNCSITKDNEEITCFSAPGAGYDHEWFITIAGQVCVRAVCVCVRVRVCACAVLFAALYSLAHRAAMRLS
jgi:hypothetical protein